MNESRKILNNRGVELFFILTTALLFISVLGSLLLAWKASSWPTVEGIIVASKVERKTWERNDHEFGHTYHPVVRYEYVVDDVKRCGSVISYDFALNFLKYAFDPKAAATTCSKYPVGTVVVVAYSPTFPSLSVLDQQVAWWFKISVTATLCVLLIAEIAIFIRNLKKALKIEPPPFPGSRANANLEIDTKKL